MKNILIVLTFSFCLSAYNVGDKINDNHLNQQFDLCYPSSNLSNNSFSLSDFDGNSNGGDYHVLVIDMSATWCGPCQSLIPLFDELEQNYTNNNYVKLFVALSDLNQPYSCTQWGNLGSSGIPNIIDDTGYPLFNMFNTGGSFPSLVMIDHEMRVHYKEAGYYNTFVNDASIIIDEMLSNMENSLILSNQSNLIIGGAGGMADDGDSLLNPNEPFDIEFFVSNNSFYLDAVNVSATIQNSGNFTDNYDDILFINQELDFGNISVDESSVVMLSGFVGDDVFIGKHEFELVVNAGFIDLNGDYNQIIKVYPFHIDVSLNQQGFPFDADSQIKSSPLVIDLTNDGNNEIIFGDYSGLVHVLDHNGNPILEDFFPFDTGNQIWGSPAAADIDNDGDIDFVVASKSKYLYAFDKNGLKFEYDADQYLIGTPTIGNIDDDNDLEIVFTSFSNDSKIFVINHDGSDVNGFPLLLDEKMQKGAALADFNNNGKDDIVVGTDDDNIHMIYDDGSIGFSFQAGDKIRSAPIILSYNNQKIIIVGSKDGKLYAVKENGDLSFEFDSGSPIYTSPSILEFNGNIKIFFGNDDNQIFALGINGDLLEGFPLSLIGESSSFGIVSESIVFEDLDFDGLPEIIFGDDMGKLNILKSNNGNFNDLSFYNNMPISNISAFASSVNIADIDNDGDLDIFSGSTGDMQVIDIKEQSDSNNYWNLFRLNYLRNGYYQSNVSCSLGDINNDFIINILDIVSIVNAIISGSSLTESEICASDLNLDGTIDILDIVTLVNIIMSEN